MLQFDFENSVGYWVTVARHHLARAMNDELAALGITYRQWEVLAWISASQELSQAALADLMVIEAPTLVGVLDRMERDGWIVRVHSPTDRRKNQIRATERVQPEWEKMVACAHRVRARATQGLSAPQLESLRQMLETIRDNLAADNTVAE